MRKSRSKVKAREMESIVCGYSFICSNDTTLTIVLPRVPRDSHAIRVRQDLGERWAKNWYKQFGFPVLVPYIFPIELSSYLQTSHKLR